MSAFYRHYSNVSTNIHTHVNVNKDLSLSLTLYQQISVSEDLMSMDVTIYSKHEFIFQLIVSNVLPQIRFNC